MSGLDILILLILSLSVAIGIFRGFLRESVSLAKWVLSSVFAWLFAWQATGLLEKTIEDETVRLVAAFIGIFVVVYAASSVAAVMLQRFIGSSGVLRFSDTILGAVVGALRGGLIIVLVFLLIGLSPPIQENRWWRKSLLAPYFQPAAAFTSEKLLPRDIARHIHYD